MILLVLVRPLKDPQTKDSTSKARIGARKSELLIESSLIFAYLSRWQMNMLLAFSAPRKVSSSIISTAVIQLGE